MEKAVSSFFENKKIRIFLGEFTGTFLMCFLGIGAVAVATLFSAMTGPFQVGMVWGLAITISIYVARNLSCAHFNPAVSFAMCLAKRLTWKTLPRYIFSQCAGAFCAAAVLWWMFSGAVGVSLENASIDMSVRGAASSIWIEVFPNAALGSVSPLVAMVAEAFGVFILVMVIFSLTEKCNTGGPGNSMAPLFIGLTVTVIICVVGPLTDAGLNPARDFMPRLFAIIAGWGSVAISLEDIIVYVIGPFVGAAVAALYFTQVIERSHVVPQGDIKCQTSTKEQEPA
jgi:glycerol uptake facilitator protein